MTEVVNLRQKGVKPDVVIDRRTIWGNPFKIGKDGTREEVVAKYASWILTKPCRLRRLKELTGKKLGCWCHPLPCHGDVLAKLADNLHVHRISAQRYYDDGLDSLPEDPLKVKITDTQYDEAGDYYDIEYLILT